MMYRSSLLQTAATSRSFSRPLSQSLRDYRKRTIFYYSAAGGIFMLGLGYAGVPLYRIYCSVNFFG